MTVRNIMLGLQCMLLASVLNSWSLFIWVFTENKTRARHCSRYYEHSNGEGRRSRSVSVLEFGFPWWANSQQANKYSFQMMMHAMKKLNQNSRIKDWLSYSERKSSPRCPSSPSDPAALGTLRNLWAKVWNCSHTMRHLWSSLTSSVTFSGHKTFVIAINTNVV